MLGRLGMVLAAALLLWGCAADLSYAELEAKYASPASRYLDLPDGVRVHYRDQGQRDGQPLVLLHGFSASLHTWEPWVRELGDDYRIVSLDLPGHGLTRTPDGYALSTAGNVAVVQGVARALELDPFVLAGNSMGGAVAWNYAIAHPDRLRGLVLVNAAGWPRSEAPDSQPLAFRLMGNPIGRALLKNLNPRPVAGPGLKDAYLDERLVTKAVVDRYVDFARAPGRRALLLAPREAPRTPTRPETFAAITTPTLVIHGDEDRLIPVADGRALAGAIPGARLITYPKVGHIPMEQIAERSAADVRSFVESLPPTP